MKLLGTSKRLLLCLPPIILIFLVLFLCNPAPLLVTKLLLKFLVTMLLLPIFFVFLFDELVNVVFP